MTRRITTAREPLKMCPSFFASDKTDSSVAHSKNFSQLSLCQDALTNLNNVSLSKFRIVVALPPKRTIGLNHLSHIFGLRSSMKVLWLNTNSSMARVQDKWLAFCEQVVNIKDFVRGNVSISRHSVQTKYPIAVTSTDAPQPIPASFVGGIGGHKPLEAIGLIKPWWSTRHPVIVSTGRTSR